jgi:hypoxanthine phosphoribosyltransferase
MTILTITDKHFRSLVSEIARQITLSDWRPDYIVGITRGGLLPAVMLSHYFDVPCETLKVSLRDGSEQESNLWMAEDAFGYNDGRQDPLSSKNILLVDDINDTGATFNWIMNDWPSGCLPNDAAWNSVWGKNVKFAVIVDNASSKCNASMNYFGMRLGGKNDTVASRV